MSPPYAVCVRAIGLGACVWPSPDHLSDVGGDEVTDELLGVVVDGTTFLHSRHNGGKVVVSQDHFWGTEREKQSLITHSLITLTHSHITLTHHTHSHTFTHHTHSHHTHSLITLTHLRHFWQQQCQSPWLFRSPPSSEQEHRSLRLLSAVSAGFIHNNQT